MKPLVPSLNKFYNGPAPGWMAACRGAALGLSLILTFNAAEVFVFGTSPAAAWISSLHPASQSIGITILSMTAVACLLFALHPALPGPVWLTTLVLIVTFVTACGRELWNVFQTVPQSQQMMAMARPLGALMLLGVAGLGVVTGRSASVRGKSSFTMILCIAAVAIIAFATVMVQSGGLSDAIPDQPGQLIVIVAEPVDASGAASEAVLDRVRTAAAVRTGSGIAGPLVICGLSGEDREPDEELIRQLTEAAALPRDQLEFLSCQPDTDSILREIAARPELPEQPRVILVAHWYQLARLRLLARRLRLEPVAVAAEQSHALFNQNVLVAKEVAATLMALADPGVHFARQLTIPADQQHQATDEARQPPESESRETDTLPEP